MSSAAAAVPAPRSAPTHDLVPCPARLQGTNIYTSRTFFGACFMSVLFISFGGFPQVSITMEQKK